MIIICIFHTQKTGKSHSLNDTMDQKYQNKKRIQIFNIFQSIHTRPLQQEKIFQTAIGDQHGLVPYSEAQNSGALCSQLNL